MEAFLRVMGLVMILIYLILGFLLIFSGYFSFIPDETRTLIGIVVLAYGAMRGARYYVKYSKKKDL